MQLFLYGRDNPDTRYQELRKQFVSVFADSKISSVSNIDMRGGTVDPYSINDAVLDNEHFFYGADGVCVFYEAPDFNFTIIAKICADLGIPLFVFVHKDEQNISGLAEKGKIFLYTDLTFVSTIKELITDFPVYARGAKPLIKFTLRISSPLEHFIEKQSKARKVSKADYVRSLVQKEMDSE